MTTQVGKDGAVYSSSNQVAEIRDWSVEQSSEVAADTAMGDDWVTNKTTLKSWTASFNFWRDASDTTGQVALAVGSSITLNLYPTGNTTGEKYITGTAIISSINATAAVDGIIEGSCAVTGNGSLDDDATVA